LNPTNVEATDGQYATAALTTLVLTSRILNCTGFGFSIPTGATINGISAAVIRHATVGSTVSDATVTLLKGGVVSGNNKASATLYGTTDATATYGGSADLWGLTLLASDVNASNFGIVFNVQSSGAAATADVDSITLTVFYTGGATKQVTLFFGGD
jgi:hypothetical protein